MSDTIFALSSGPPPAGVAIIRASGARVRFGLEMIVGSVPEPRHATLRSLRDPSSGELLDSALVLYFPGPASFTGEDILEFHVHGGRAVVAAVLGALAALEGYRPAEAGEFTRRAFANGRADLTEVEGLADLVTAETEMQRRLALRQAEGGLRRLYEGWRARLLRARALIEAELDFSEEEDVPGDVAAPAWTEAVAVAAEIARHLDDGRWGERVRSGFEVVLLGAPNVGKSSLLNALVRREAAIVTAEAGTTRDIIEVALDIHGHAVTLIDTAGLRDASNVVEQEGIRRAVRRAEAADLILRLDDGDAMRPEIPEDVPVLDVRTKADLFDSDSKQLRPDRLFVSAQTGAGLTELQAAIAAALKLDRPVPSVMLTRGRQRHGLEAALLPLAEIERPGATEVKAELLRQSADAIGRITGRIDVEDLLDVIFGEFCIGK